MDRCLEHNLRFKSMFQKCICCLYSGCCGVPPRCSLQDHCTHFSSSRSVGYWRITVESLFRNCPQLKGAMFNKVYSFFRGSSLSMTGSSKSTVWASNGPLFQFVLTWRPILVLEYPINVAETLAVLASQFNLFFCPALLPLSLTGVVPAIHSPTIPLKSPAYKSPSQSLLLENLT